MSMPQFNCWMIGGPGMFQVGMCCSVLAVWFWGCRKLNNPLLLQELGGGFAI